MAEEDPRNKRKNSLFLVSVVKNGFNQFRDALEAGLEGRVDQADESLRLAQDSFEKYLDGLGYDGLDDEESEEFGRLSKLLDSFLLKGGRKLSTEEDKRHKELYDKWLKAMVNRS